jgi:ATP-dependent RNA helicase DeaD
MTGPAGIELLPITSARRATRMMAGRPVLATAGSPRDVRDLVKSTNLKLDSVKAVVLAWADEILAGDEEDIEALEAVMGELPKDAARIVVTSRSEGRVNAFAERYLRRALRDVTPEDDSTAAVPVQYVTVAATARGTALRRVLDDLDPPSAAIVVNDSQSEEIALSTLKLLGYGGGNSPVRVTRGEIAPSTNAVIFFDLPTSRAQLSVASVAGAVSVVALVEAREVPALRRLSGGAVKPFALVAAGNSARDRDAAIRRELTGILDSGVASREVLALEPLLERHDGIEIAAAALRLLERERTLRKAAQEEARAQQDVARAPAAPAGFDRGSRPDRPRSDRSSGGDRKSFGDRPPRSGTGGRDFRGGESRGPRDSHSPRDAGPRGGSRGAPSRGGPPRGDRPSSGGSRPPRRDRP